jgi:mono/diheme cytochrome c family protein
MLNSLAYRMRLKIFSEIALAFFISLCAARADTVFTFQDHPGQYLDILGNGKIVGRYMYAHDDSTPEKRTETYKPYLHVFDAEGIAPITKGPGGIFAHHRAVFVGWRDIVVDGKHYDRWHMLGGDQVHQKFLAEKADATGAAFTSLIEWDGSNTGGQSQPILEEERTMTFLPPTAPAYAEIDLSTRLKALAGDTTLGGDPEHSGIQFRPANEVDTKKTVYYFPKAGANPHKDRDYPWLAETFTLNGKQYSVIYLNDPANPRDTAFSAYRDYGRFGGFFKATIPKGGELTLHIRLLVVEGGLPPVAAIQDAYNAFAGVTDAVPTMTKWPGETSPKDTKNGTAGPTPTPPRSATTMPFNPGLAALLASHGGPQDPKLVFRPPPPPPLSPQEELKTFKLPPGFKIELVAAEPLVQAPTAISFDDQDAMYVVEMRDYMADIADSEKESPSGRVSKLVSSKGDGVMDQSTVFVDHLVEPRAVMAVGDGALIGEPPNLTFYHDPGRTGVAQSSEVVDTTFGTRTGQPEHMANQPTWMLDNWIWCCNHPVRYRWNQGKFILARTVTVGQWGLSQDDWGRLFFNYNSNLLFSNPVPPEDYRNPHIRPELGVNHEVIKDQTVWPSHPTPGVNRGYGPKILRPDGTLAATTATCGPCIYRGDLFPKEYEGNAFVPEPAGNLIKRLVLTDSNGLITGKSPYVKMDFLTSTDERFRPVNTYTGPDGALYIVDMYRGIIQHQGFMTTYLAANVVDRKLEEPLNCGRIFRVVPTGAVAAPVKLPAGTAAIVPFLSHPNGWVRDTAQRLLVERGDTSVVPAIQKIAADGHTPQARVQALWTLQGLGAVDPQFFAARLADRHPQVRIAAIRILGDVPAVQKLVNDPDPEVRMHVAFTLSSQPGPASDALQLALLRKGETPLILDGVASGLAGRELDFIREVLKDPALAGTRTGILTTLASCIMNHGRRSEVAQLLDLTASRPGSGGKIALLRGMTPTRTRLIYLDAKPRLLDQLASTSGPGLKKLAARLDARLAWPGKPGVPPPPVVAPLTADQQVLFDKGKKIYSGLCIACHQQGGDGLAGLAPPLEGSEWVEGSASRPIRIVLKGLVGPVTVDGTKWNLEMPALAMLTDEDIAAALTYVRREWENTGTPVSVEQVAALRNAVKDRAQPWTSADLGEKGKAPVETSN